MSRIKLFLENMLIYGLSGIVSGLIPYVMLPFLAKIMPDSSYMGIYDVSTSMTSLLMTFSIFGMYDAMFRLFFDGEDDEHRRRVCSSALLWVIIVSIVTIAVLFCIAPKLAEIFLGDEQYKRILWICGLSIGFGAANTIVSAPARMQNRRVLILCTNAIVPIVSYSIGYYLLKKGFYEYGMQIGSVLSVLVALLVYYIINRKWFDFKSVDYNIWKQLMNIALPIVPIFLIYWIFSAADRLIVSTIIGTAAAGVYAVGSKVSQMSQLLYLAFSGGWQYFAFSTMKDKDQVEMTTLIFEILEGAAFVFSIVVLVFLKWPYQLLFEEQYWEAIYIVPYLFVCPLILMLYQVVANQFLVIKKTYYSTICLTIGVIVNIVLNFVLIKYMGYVGVSIASLIGYLVSLIAALIILNRFNLIHIKTRPIRVGIIGLVYLGIWQYISEELLLLILFSIIFVLIILVNYTHEIKKGIRSVVSRYLK